MCYNMVIDFRNCKTIEERDMVRDLYTPQIEKMDSADYVQYGNLMNLLFEETTDRICKEMGYKEDREHSLTNLINFIKGKCKKQ